MSTLVITDSALPFTTTLTGSGVDEIKAYPLTPAGYAKAMSAASSRASGMLSVACNRVAVLCLPEARLGSFLVAGRPIGYLAVRAGDQRRLYIGKVGDASVEVGQYNAEVLSKADRDARYKAYCLSLDSCQEA